VEFLLRLREERRFASTEALVSRIRKDVAAARRFFEWVWRVVPECPSGDTVGRSR
jgi:hypothetical protein